MVKIYVDGVAYEADPKQNLLHACLSNQLELPYFCWHPSLGSVGACRQCAVIQYQNEEDEQGRLTMACMSPVTEGARISIQADPAREFRSSVIEWLMENHPHDCPVCEEGGECHLQDMTVMTGHTSRRYRGMKRTFENQYLGPFLNHEMNRCITCYRCVRFYRDYAGGSDLQAFGSRARMYFGRTSDGVLDNEFSGNLVEVCPTGVFTDKPFSSTYTRKWDLQSAPSICSGCAVGCNTFNAERYGQLKRVHNRYHGELNQYFLCDRGRFGAAFVNSESRIRHAGRCVEPGVFEEIELQTGIERLAELLKTRSVIGIGSPRASLETNVALSQLVGEDSFCNGLSDNEADCVDGILAGYRTSGAQIASLADVEAADAVLVLGEDVLNTAPRIALALRQAVRNDAFSLAADVAIPAWQDIGVRGHAQGRMNPLFLASVAPTRIDDIATLCLREIPEQIAAAGFAIARGITDEAADHSDPFVAAAIDALSHAQRPLIIAGSGAGSRQLIDAAAAIARGLAGPRRNAESEGRQPYLLLVPQEANSIGCGLMNVGLTMDTALERAAAGEVQTLVVTENDLFRRASLDLVTKAIAAVDHLVVLDCIDTPTATAAEMVLPAATFAESTGTFVNMEGRAQRFFSVFGSNPTTYTDQGEATPAWRLLAQATALSDAEAPHWDHVDDVLRAVAALPRLERLRGLLTAFASRGADEQKVARETHRYSGRTAMYADASIHEPRTAIDTETPLSFSMEGFNRGDSGAPTSFVWAPGWNSNQSVFKYQDEVGGSMRGGDSGVRLIDAGNRKPPSDARTAGPTHADTETASAAEREDMFRLLASHDIFLSDELALRAPAIMQSTLR